MRFMARPPSLPARVSRFRALPSNYRKLDAIFSKFRNQKETGRIIRKLRILYVASSPNISEWHLEAHLA